MNVTNIEYTISLTGSEIYTLALALAKACSYETEYLKYIDHCEDVRSDPAICGYRDNVSRYLLLRNHLLDLLSGSLEEERIGFSDKFDATFHAIVNEWNKEIERIRRGDNV